MAGRQAGERRSSLGPWLALTQNKTSCLTTAFPKNPLRVFGRVSSATYSARLVSRPAVPTSPYCVAELLGSQHLSEELSPIFKVKKSYLAHARVYLKRD